MKLLVDLAGFGQGGPQFHRARSKGCNVLPIAPAALADALARGVEQRLDFAETAEPLLDESGYQFAVPVAVVTYGDVHRCCV